MEIGLILALLVAVLFGASDVFVRRGVLKTGESYTAVLIGLFIGVLLALLMITFTMQWDKVWVLSGQLIGLLAVAGTIQLVGGRYLYYISVRLIGANKSSAIARTDVFASVVLGIIILNEPLTIPLVLGVLLIVPGVILVSVERQGAGVEERMETYRTQAKGILSGMGAGLCWGISGVLIKPAVRAIGSPFVGTFVSYVFAFLIMASLLFGKERREQLLRLNRASLTPIIIAGIGIATAHFFKFAALMYSPVSLVQPLTATHILFLLLFSFLLNRNIEVFTRKVIIGMMLAVVGTIILSL